jgi:hypothetical protein
MMIQVHRSAAAGSRIFGVVQPSTCLNSRKVCSRAGPAQERLPAPGYLGGGQAGGGNPQPDRLGVAVAGQVIDGQPD